MSVREMPKPDRLVEIDIPVGEGHRTITRRIVTTRDHGDGRWTCLLADTDTGELSSTTIAPAERGHWVCVLAPVPMDGAIHVARSVQAGVTLHRSVTEQMRVLSEAVLLLTGNARSAAPCTSARVSGSC